MEKQANNPRSKILKFLPRAASAVNFRSQLPFSPGRDKRLDSANKLTKAHASKGFSGPIVKMIPDEVRRKPKNQGGGGAGGYENQEEPTSPKVSCIGQIKHKKKMCKSKSLRTTTARQETKAKVVVVENKKQESSSRVGGLFGRNKKPAAARKSDASRYDKPPLPDLAAPALGQMRRFASGRDTLAGFDWTVQIAPEEPDHDHRRDCYSDDEEGSEMDDQEDEGFIVPFSAPLSLGGDGAAALQARKEINLWKRRIMNPPRPLQLNSTLSKK